MGDELTETGIRRAMTRVNGYRGKILPVLVVAAILFLAGWLRSVDQNMVRMENVVTKDYLNVALRQFSADIRTSAQAQHDDVKEDLRIQAEDIKKLIAKVGE